MSASPRENAKTLLTQRDPVSSNKTGISHQKLSKYHYHLKADQIYGDKKLKLCGQCIMPDNLSKDLKQLSKYVKRVNSNENLNESINNNVSKIELEDYVDSKKLLDNEFSSRIDLKALDLTTERQSGLNMPLVYLPPELFRFKQLQRLHLDCNQIRTIPDMLGENLVNLEILTLTYNNLIFLPSSIKNLKKLKSLHLGHNKFHEFPEVLCELDSLTFLDLSCNALDEISPNVEKMKQLESLLLYQNQLTFLPEAIGKLAYLTTLWVGSNKITRLPKQIAQLTRLDWTEKNFNLSSNFDGNPLEDPPFDVCIKGIEAIREYFYPMVKKPKNKKEKKELSAEEIN